jgi:hypothetical protein
MLITVERMKILELFLKIGILTNSNVWALTFFLEHLDCIKYKYQIHGPFLEKLINFLRLFAKDDENL